MAEDALREGLTLRVASEVAAEAIGLGDWEVSLDEGEGAFELIFFDDHTAPLVERVVDASDDFVGGDDFAEEHGLQEGGLGAQLQPVEEPSGGGDDLPGLSVGGVSVDGGVGEVEPDSPHVLAVLLRGRPTGRRSRGSP